MAHKEVRLQQPGGVRRIKIQLTPKLKKELKSKADWTTVSVDSVLAYAIEELYGQSLKEVVNNILNHETTYLRQWLPGRSLSRCIQAIMIEMLAYKAGVIISPLTGLADEPEYMKEYRKEKQKLKKKDQSTRKQI